MVPEIGDKVRLKTTAFAGARGVIEGLERDIAVVRISGSNCVSVAVSEFTNYSLAARKAWQNMPHRQVGRPKGTRVCDRVSVTLRIDREVWDWFRRLESQGLLSDPTASVNEWLRENLSKLDSRARRRNGKKS